MKKNLPGSGRLIGCIGILFMVAAASRGWPSEQPATSLSTPAIKISREEYIQRRLHENELMNQRLNWLLASQTLLFAGYGALLNADLVEQLKRRIARVAVTLGVASALSIWLGVIAAIGASFSLAEEVHDRTFLLGLRVWTNWFGWSPSLVLPLLFIFAWMILPTAGFSSLASSDQPGVKAKQPQLSAPEPTIRAAPPKKGRSHG